MKIQIIILFFLLLFITAASQKPPSSWYTIKAFLPLWNNATISIEKEDGHIGSGRIENDMFSFTGSCTGPFAALIHLAKNGKNMVLPFFIEPGTIRLRSKSEFNCYVFGTPLNDSFAKFEYDIDSFARNTGVMDVRKMKRLSAELFIKQNSSSLLSLRLLNEYFYLDPSANDSVYYALYNSLDQALKNTPAGRKIGQEAGGRIATAKGSTAPLMKLINTAGNEEVIYQPGNITLIHFWATWCVPCREELIQLRNTLAKFSGRSLQVVMISLDYNKELWKQSVGPQQPGWRQLIDPGGWEGMSAKAYGVKAIPANYLVDEQGRIIARHVTVDDINRELRQLLH
jgi:peroxiredoxin